MRTQYSQADTHTPLKTLRSPQSRTILELNDIEQRIKEISETKNEKIALLQGEISQLREENTILAEKLDEQINDNEWLTKFCLSFVSMAGKIASVQLGKSILEPRHSLRKNTKIAWKYFKGFVK